MNRPTLFVALVALHSLSIPALNAVEAPPALKNPKPLFDGKTFAGWEGDPKIWRV